MALATLLLSATALSAHADVVTGTQGFGDIGATTVEGDDLRTATTFTLGDMLASRAATGIFVDSGTGLSGVAFENFGSVTFSSTSGTSLFFSGAGFGSFQSQSITQNPTVCQNELGSRCAVSLYVLGSWTPGTWGGVTGGARDASFTVSFTETWGIYGQPSFSASATFAVPPAPVPELSSWAMMLTGFAGLGVAGAVASRKRAAAAA